MRVAGRENVWAIGDAAAVPDPAKGGKQPSPPTAQHGLRQGKVVGDNVAATLSGGRCARSATGRWACSWTWASTRRWRRCSAFGCAASPRGSPPAPTT